MTSIESQSETVNTADLGEVLDLAPYAITHYHSALFEVAESVQALAGTTSPAHVSRRLWSAIDHLRDAHAPGDDIVLAEQISATMRKLDSTDPIDERTRRALKGRLTRLTNLWRRRLPVTGGHC